MAQQRQEDTVENFIQDHLPYLALSQGKQRQLWQAKPKLLLELLLTLSSIFGVDSEGGRFVDHSVGKTRTIGSDMATINIIHIELQRTS